MTDKETTKVIVRVGREALELEGKIDRLKTALENKDLKISDDHRKLLKEQLEIMTKSDDILKRRIDDLTFNH